MKRIFLSACATAFVFGVAFSAGAQTISQSPVETPQAIAPATPAAPAALPVAPIPEPVAPVAVPAAPDAIIAPAEVAPQTAVDTAVPAEAPIAAPEVGGAPKHSGHDLSPLGMYQQADLVVKSVMIILMAAAFVSWTVLIYKLVETFVARSRARNAARLLTKADSLVAATKGLASRRDPAAFMAHAVWEEFRRSEVAIDPAGGEGVKERAVSLVHRVEVQAASRLRRGMGILATIGSVSPFVGLFGTVWGIMNSFIGIAETQTTNLAVVAPGIAEALFATALGLVAAIPAVVIYNHFTRVIQGYKQLLGDAGAATLRLLSRDIDFRKLEG